MLDGGCTQCATTEKHISFAIRLFNDIQHLKLFTSTLRAHANSSSSVSSLPPNYPNMSAVIDSCESKLTINLSCAGLRNMDIIGRSDPFAILFLDPTGTLSRRRTQLSPSDPSNSSNLPDAMPAPVLRSVTRGRYPGRDGQWQRVGTTETVPNSLDVTFSTSFEIPYFFERAQKLAVDVFDRDHGSERDADIHRQDYLGSAELSVPSLVRAPGQKRTIPLTIPDLPSRRCGTVTFVAEEVVNTKLRLAYDISLSNLSSSSSLHKGKGPFLTISRRSAASPNDHSWITVYRSETPGIPVSPGAFQIERLSRSYERICRCDDNMDLRFEISFLKGGKDRVVASAKSSLAQSLANDGVINLQRTERSLFPSSKVGGKLYLRNRTVTEDITFLDYIIGGCEISLVIAIDFSASNGNPQERGTLHFWDSMDVNEYEMAIRAVGDILAAYDSDQLFPAYGFGAKLPPDFLELNHKFSLTTTDDPTCHTIEEVLHMYRHALYNVRLSGPTQFTEIIRAAADHARADAEQNEQSYTILLIITDGIINDFDSTLKEIGLACHLPLSIVVIGVGNADFTDMNKLDRGNTIDRDIVQFVNFRQYKDAPEVLRAKVLEEIPDQFLQYMKMKGIAPMAPPDD